MTSPFPRQLILGHRGSGRGASENTLSSFARALTAGADGVELDVQRSRDGVPVVIHDETLDRTMSVGGLVAALPWRKIERISGARVPSLDQVVAWTAAAGAWLNVELKASKVEEAVLASIEDVGIQDRVVISSFDPEIVRRVGEVNPRVTRFFLTEVWTVPAESAFERSGAAGVCLRVDAADETTLAELRKRELPVIVWTVNDPGTVSRLLASGVAGLITDDPAMAARVRAESLDA